MYRNDRQPHLRLPASVPAWSVQTGDVIRIDAHEVPGDGTAPGHGTVEVTAVTTETDRDGRTALAAITWRARTRRACGVAFYAIWEQVILLRGAPGRRTGLGPC